MAQSLLMLLALCVASGQLQNPDIKARQSETSPPTQTVGPTPQNGPGLNSNGSMPGVTLQRTYAYSTRGISSLPATVLWTSAELFFLQESFEAQGSSGPFSFELTFPSDHKHSNPILSDGMICLSYYNGTGYLLTLNANNGVQKVKYEIKATALSPIAVAAGTAYVGGSNGKFYAVEIDAKRGRSLVFRKDYRFDLTAPFVADGIVYFSGAKEAMSGNVRPDGIFYAVEASTGKELWSVKLKGYPTSAAMDVGTVFVGDDDKHLFAFDSRTGTEKWRFKAGSNVASPAVIDEVVLFSDADGNLYAVDTETGQQKWKARRSDKVGTQLALRKGTLYFGGAYNSLYAVDTATGEEKWKFKTSKRCATPVLTDDLVYFGCLDKTLNALEVISGRVKWQYKSQQPIWANPIIADGTLYFLDTSAVLHAMR